MQIDAFSYARENICQIMTIMWEVKNNQEPTGWHTKYLSYGVRTYLQTMFLEYVTRRVFFLSHFESLSNNQKLSDLTDHNISIHGRPIILIEPRSAGLKLDLFSFFFQPEQCFSLTTFQPEQCFLAKFQTSERDGIIVCHLSTNYCSEFYPFHNYARQID